MLSKELLSSRQNLVKISIATGVIVIILASATVAAYRYAKNRIGSIVLPGGITYLGPVSEQKPKEPGRFTIAADTPWAEYRGLVYPYTFSYPATLPLGVFPNDPLDAVTIFWGGNDARLNLILRVENLNTIPNVKQYVNSSKRKYSEDWWKQYNWTGVGSITEFTNARGLKGYRAKYLDGNGQTPFDNIFFEVPGHNDLVIWMSGSLLDQAVFDRIVDSVAWVPITPTPNQ